MANKVLKNKLMNWKQFKQKYGTDTTTNFQLIKWAKDLKIKPFHYAMRDEIKHLPKHKNPLYVITNIHTSDKKGIHHSAFYRNKTKAYFFDSYGLPPTQEVIEFVQGVEGVWHTADVFHIYSKFLLQKLGDKYCGQMSLYVLYKLKSGENFEDIILDIKNELSFS